MEEWTPLLLCSSSGLGWGLETFRWRFFSFSTQSMWGIPESSWYPEIVVDSGLTLCALKVNYPPYLSAFLVQRNPFYCFSVSLTEGLLQFGSNTYMLCMFWRGFVDMKRSVLCTSVLCLSWTVYAIWKEMWVGRKGSKWKLLLNKNNTSGSRFLTSLSVF